MTELHVTDLIRKSLNQQRENLLAVVSALDDDLLDSRPHDAAQTFHETLLHLARCYEFYTTSAMKGTKDPAPYRPPAYHSIPELHTLINRVCEAAGGRLGAYTAETLAETVTYNETAVTRGELLAEMLIHAQHHIGQIQLALRLLGREPAAVRFLV